MNKEIHIYYINRIKELQEEIFDEQNSYYFDNRVVANKERAIENCLNKAKITDKKLRKEILSNVNWSYDNCTEILESLGWTILRGKELL